MDDLDQILTKISLQKRICTGPIWEDIQKKLDSKFGPKDIIGVITNYALLEQTNPHQEIIPPELELHELGSIIKKVASIRNGLNENLVQTTYTAMNIIFDNPEKYRLLTYCIGNRPNMKQVKSMLETV